MALTKLEQDDLREILVAFYGPSARGNILTPTEETLRLTEEFFLRIHECNRGVRTLMRNLPVAIIGKGFLRKCLKRMVKLVTKNIEGFRGCESVMKASLLKNRIFISTW